MQTYLLRPRRKLVLTDGRQLVGHLNYQTETHVELIADDGSFHWLERTAVKSAVPIVRATSDDAR